MLCMYLKCKKETSNESSGRREEIEVKTPLRRSATDSMIALRMPARLVRKVMPVNVPVVGLAPCKRNEKSVCLDAEMSFRFVQL